MDTQTIKYLADQQLEILLDNLRDLYREKVTDLNPDQLAQLLTQLGRPTEVYELGGD